MTEKGKEGNQILNKLKRFAKMKWHSLPIGALALALVASMAVTGIAFAAVALLDGTATVTVPEAITIDEHTPTDGSWSSPDWTVGAYPAETKTLTLKLTNAGSVGIPVYVTIEDLADFTESIFVYEDSDWVTYDTSYTVTGTGYVQFQIEASASCPADTYNFDIDITR